MLAAWVLPRLISSLRCHVSDGERASNRHLPARVWLLAGLVFCVPSRNGFGQRVATEDAPTASATLPASHDAMLLVSQTRQAIGQGDYRLAVALIERLSARPGDLVVATTDRDSGISSGRTYYPVWRQAANLLAQLPPEGLQLYRQLYDAEVIARLREAARTGDIPALRELFRTYPASSAWPAVGQELVAQLFDAARFAEAMEVIRRLTESDAAARGGAGTPVPQLGPERRAQLAVCLNHVGQRQAANRVLAALEADAAVVPRPDWGNRLAALRASLDSDPTRTTTPDSAEPLTPAWQAGPIWREALEPADPLTFCDDDVAIADAVDRLHRFPLPTPVVDGDRLVVRLRGTVWAFDALTLTPLWRTAERVSVGRGESGPWGWSEGMLAPTDRGDSGTVISSDASSLLSHALRHAVSTGFGLVLTIESLPPVAAGSSGGGVLHRFGGGQAANELVARDLQTGRLVWRTAGDLDDPLYGVAFQDSPVALDDKLCVAMQRGDDLHLALLDPATGELVREVSVVGPPTYFSYTGGRCLLATDETSVCVCTGNGVIAALSRDDLSWRWATTYPSTLAERRAAGWWPPQQEPREWGVERPVTTDELLVLAPVDCPYIFALDRFSGHERWRIDRGTSDFLVGAVGAGVLIGRDAITCVDSADGRTPRWRSLPLPVIGRPTVRDERLYLPTRDGVVVLDARSGKVLAEASGLERATRPMAANLIATPDALLAVSPNAVVKYADLAATRRRCETLLAHDARHEGARLALAWVARLQGAYEKALATLEGFQPTEAPLATARARLLTDIFVALSAESKPGAERLAWLRCAAGLSAAPEARARLAVLIGRTLMEGGAWDEAAQHYADMLADTASVLVPAENEPQFAAAGWLHAVDRLRETLAHLEAARSTALLKSWLGDAAGTAAQSASPEFLQRLRLMLAADAKTRGPTPPDAGAWRGRIDRALLLSPLPPELRARYLPEGESAGPGGAGPQAEEARHLHLARWETHVAANEHGAKAAKEQGEKQTQPQANEPSAAASPSDVIAPEESRRIRRIETSLTKLEDAAGVPFGRELTGRYQWKVLQAELIADERMPTSAMRDWIPVRKLEDLSLALHSAVLGRQWHQTTAAIQGGPGAQAALNAVAESILAGAEGAGLAGPRDVWPAAISGYLAAVPVHGGLVCIGLGPERGAGQRLWEHPIPEWADGPPGFVERAAAGPQGVYVVRRNDRIALLGWSDGQTWWQRELPGMHIRQIGLAGGRLVAVGQDGAVAALDATFGDRLHLLGEVAGRPEGTAGSGAGVSGAPRGVAIVADTVVVWGDEEVAGFDPETFERRWVRPARGVATWTAVTGTTWLAYRDETKPDWILLDVRSGRPVFQSGLGDLGQVAVAALDRAQLLLAGFERKATNQEVTPTVRLAAFDSTSRRWRASTSRNCWRTPI
jgi:outer membrane protein assembly factor BamB